MDWWGYSSEHGWVVLDRNIPCNGSGIKDDLLFFRWRDLSLFRAARDDWKPPLYVFAPNYLLGKPEATTHELKSLKNRWPDVKAEMLCQVQKFVEEQKKAVLEKEIQQATAKHKLRLDRLGIHYQGTSNAAPGRGRRAAHCYLCKRPLDNAINVECAVCGWIICHCGACGCGYAG